MSEQRTVRSGYLLALGAAGLSGVAVFVNAMGVKTFKDATTYTTLKNGVAGVLALAPVLLAAGPRAELARLHRRQAVGLVGLALISGSLPFVLFFEGLRTAGPVAGALFNHLQFAFAAVLAAWLLRERIAPAMWLALAALVVATNLAVNLGAVRLDRGTALLAASSILFAAGFVLARRLLGGLSTATVSAARLTLGAAFLFVYLELTHRAGGIATLTAAQWQFVLATGVLLFAFTATTLAALKRAPVSAVLAIAMAAPAITIALEAARAGRLNLSPPDAAGTALTLLLITVILVLGLRPLEQPLAA